MTRPDALQLFKDKCRELGQSKVAAALGISSPAVNQLYHDKYNASPETILQRVIEVYGGVIVDCPVLGDVPLSRCADERKKGFATSRVAIWQACRTCKRRSK